MHGQHGYIARSKGPEEGGPEGSGLPGEVSSASHINFVGVLAARYMFSYGQKCRPTAKQVGHSSTRKYFIEPERQKQCLHIKKYVKTEDDEKEDDQRESMEKPAKLKTVTWMLRGVTKAMSTMKIKSAKAVPRVTPTQSKWRIWDPGRSEAVVLREVIVRIKHDPMPERQHVRIVHVYK
jgi:hypothetical protein